MKKQRASGLASRQASGRGRSSKSILDCRLADLLICCLLPTCCLSARAQNVEGQIIASQYGNWKVPGYAPDTFKDFAPTVCRVQGGASFFSAFTVGTPIRIVDGNPSRSEVVVPSAVTENNSECSIAIHPVNHHQPPFYFTSATGGLQEAINANIANPGPNTILLNNEWYQLGGTPATITSVHGTAQLGLVDVTQVPAKWYHWNGSQYVTINPPASGANTLVNDLVSNNSTDSFQDLYHFYATGPAYNAQNAVNAAVANGGSVTIQPGAGDQPFTPPTGYSDYWLDDHRLNVPAFAQSFKKFGGQCDAAQTFGTFTPGSNQVTNINMPYAGSGGYLTPLSAYADDQAVLAVGWRDPKTGQQWVWEPTIHSVNGTTFTLNSAAPANIPTDYAFVVGHDDTAAFQALSNYIPLASIMFPSSIYRGCLTHAFTFSHSAGAVMWEGQWSSTIMGFPGEDVIKIASGSADPLKMVNLQVDANDQVDARLGYTLIKADGSQVIVPPMWKPGGLQRWWGQGTPWANNPTMPGWQGQTLSAAQAATDTTIPVTRPLLNIAGDHGYNGVGSYGCVKIPDSGDGNSEIECYENFDEVDEGGAPTRDFRNAQRGMYQDLGFSPATTHALNASVVPVHPFSPLTPFITPGTAYSFEGITLQRTSNVVTVTLPSSTTIFGVTGADIEISGTGTGDFAGPSFPVVSASGTTVTYNQTGPNEGPVTASQGFAALIGTMRPTVWPAFAEGNGALTSDAPDGLAFGNNPPGYGGGIALSYAQFTSDAFNAYMPTQYNYLGSMNGTGGVWMQGGMYHVLWDDIQIRGSYGFLHPGPQVNTHVYSGYDNETNTFSRFDIHSGMNFALQGDNDGYVRALNAYSEEDPNPASGKTLPGIGPSALPTVDDQTGVVSNGTNGSMTWDQLYSEPQQYTTEVKSGYYEVYYTDNSNFGGGVAHSLNSGATLIHGNANTFNGPTWNILPSGLGNNVGGPDVFLLGDDNHGWINLFSTNNNLETGIGPWGMIVMDEGSNNQCWVTNGTSTLSACRGVARSGGSTGDWAKRGITAIGGTYTSDSELIFTSQDLLSSVTGGNQWGNGSYMGFDINEPQQFAYAAQPPSAFVSGNIRPYSLGLNSDIGSNFPAVHGVLYVMAKASATTNETYHAYYSGNHSIDQGGAAGVTLPLTTAWQIFSFGVNLQDAPGRTGTQPTQGASFLVGDDVPSNPSAEIDTAWVQFVPDSQLEASSVFQTTRGATLASASTVNLVTGLHHISGTATITTLTPPVSFFTGCVDLIPDGAWSTAAGGNIAVASTAVVGKVLRECYDGSLWYPSY